MFPITAGINGGKRREKTNSGPASCKCPGPTNEIDGAIFQKSLKVLTQNTTLSKRGHPRPGLQAHSQGIGEIVDLSQSLLPGTTILSSLGPKGPR